MDPTLEDTVIADTRRWLERAVIGLNLCPFAKGVEAKGQIHFAVSRAQDERGVLSDLQRELEALAEANPERRDTTLVMLPFHLLALAFRVTPVIRWLPVMYHRTVS